MSLLPGRPVGTVLIQTALCGNARHRIHFRRVQRDRLPVRAQKFGYVGVVGLTPAELQVAEERITRLAISASNGLMFSLTGSEGGHHRKSSASSFTVSRGTNRSLVS